MPPESRTCGRYTSTTSREKPELRPVGIPVDQQGFGLAYGLDVDPVYVDVRGQGDSPPDALGNVFGGERPDSPVRRFGLLLVAVEAHEAELGLGQPGQHLQDP